MYKKIFRDWKNSSTELTKLQYGYGAVTIVAITAAGIISLLNREVGLSILQIAGVAALTFVINGVGWSVINTVLPRDDKPAKPAKR